MRRYGCWAGNPAGVAEDTKRCIATVYWQHTWVAYQCSRKRGHGKHGLYCKQHAKKHASAEIELKRKDAP